MLHPEFIRSMNFVQTDFQCTFLPRVMGLEGVVIGYEVVIDGFVHDQEV